MPTRTHWPPESRGPLSEWTIAKVTGSGAGPAPDVRDTGADDLHLALYLAYEVHYADPATAGCDEWDPELIAFRRRLERAFEDDLGERVGPVPTCAPADVAAALVEALDAEAGPSLSTHMEERGTLAQMRQVVKHRSLYQLKEADPHTFGIPRTRGRTKQLMVRIQAGEYGADDPAHAMHSDLFARTMRALGLDDTPNAHLDDAPASALALSNLISLFGLNRRWSAALVGHLAAFELTSVTPMGRYARALHRMGAPPEARRFYEVHVLADAEHGTIALEMVRALADDEPAAAPTILFGARAALAVERAFAADLFSAWSPSTVPRAS